MDVGKSDGFWESGGEWTRRQLEGGEAIDFGRGGYYPGPEQTWTITQPGAAAIRVHFSRLDTAHGDIVRVTNPMGYDFHEYQGPLQPAFWSSVIQNDTVRISFDPNSYTSTLHRGVAIDAIEFLVNSHGASDGEDWPRIPGESCAYDDECADFDNHLGICNGGVCMFQASSASCASNWEDSCPSGTRCSTEGGTGVCYPDCDVYACDGFCDSAGSCVGY